MMNRRFKPHFFQFFRFLRPFLGFSLLPAAQSVLYALTSRPFGVAVFAEAAILLLALSAAFLRFFGFRVLSDDRFLIVRQGVLLLRESRVEWDRISSVAVQRTPPGALFGAVRVSVGTETKKGQTAVFWLKKADADRLLMRFSNAGNAPAVRFSGGQIAQTAVLTASAGGGLLFGVPIVNRAGKLFGIGLSALLLERISDAASRFETYFPPAVNIFSLVLAAGYTFSVAVGFLRLYGLKIRKSKEVFTVESGAVAPRRTAFSEKAVRDRCLEQSFLLRFFGKAAVRVAVAGFRDKRGETAWVLPALRPKEAESHAAAWFSPIADAACRLFPTRGKRMRRRFLRLPKIYFLLIAALTAFFALRFPHFARLSLFLGTVAGALCVYWGNLCDYNYRKGCLSLGSVLSARASRGFGTRTLICAADLVDGYTFRQNPADRRYHTCRVTVTVRSAGADRITVRHLDYRQICAHLSEIYGTEV